MTKTKSKRRGEDPSVDAIEPSTAAAAADPPQQQMQAGGGVEREEEEEEEDHGTQHDDRAQQMREEDQVHNTYNNNNSADPPSDQKHPRPPPLGWSGAELLKDVDARVARVKRESANLVHRPPLPPASASASASSSNISNNNAVAGSVVRDVDEMLRARGNLDPSQMAPYERAGLPSSRAYNAAFLPGYRNSGNSTGSSGGGGALPAGQVMRTFADAGGASVAAMSGSVSIGVGLAQRSDGRVVVASVQPQSAADGKLQVGDTIVGVDGTPVVGLAVTTVAQKLRGAPWSVAEVSVQRGEQSVVAMVVRRSEASAALVASAPPYYSLSSPNSAASAAMQQQIQQQLQVVVGGAAAAAAAPPPPQQLPPPPPPSQQQQQQLQQQQTSPFGAAYNYGVDDQRRRYSGGTIVITEHSTHHAGPASPSSSSAPASLGLGLLSGKDGRVTVADVLPGGPSHGKIHKGDVLVRIGQITCAGRELSEVMMAAKGAIGSTVEVDVLRHNPENGTASIIKFKLVRLRCGLCPMPTTTTTAGQPQPVSTITTTTAAVGRDETTPLLLGYNNNNNNNRPTSSSTSYSNYYGGGGEQQQQVTAAFAPHKKPTAPYKVEMENLGMRDNYFGSNHHSTVSGSSRGKRCCRCIGWGLLAGVALAVGAISWIFVYNYGAALQPTG